MTHLEGKQLSVISETFLKFLLEKSHHIPPLGTLSLQNGNLSGNHYGDLVKMG